MGPQLLNLLKLMEPPEAETKNDIKKEPENKKKQYTAKTEAVKASETDATKLQDLNVSEKQESAAKHKHMLVAGQLVTQTPEGNIEEINSNPDNTNIENVEL